MLKEGLTVKGITTASTIWVTAAIGMTIGVGAYVLAAVELVLVLATLVILNRFERVLQNIIQKRSYEVIFKPGEHSIEQLEMQLRQLGVTVIRSQLKKNANRIVILYRITAGRRLHVKLSQLLADSDMVEGFEV
jgi:putative Mg2+ transporter-C (MgtC) family protein